MLVRSSDQARKCSSVDEIGLFLCIAGGVCRGVLCRRESTYVCQNAAANDMLPQRTGSYVRVRVCAYEL